MYTHTARVFFFVGGGTHEDTREQNSDSEVSGRPDPWRARVFNEDLVNNCFFHRFSPRLFTEGFQVR